MSYTSNINEVIKGLEHKIGHLPLGEITVAVGQSLLASNIERIHEKGKAVDNTPIGQYSTKDMLVGKKSFVKKASWDSVYKSNKDKKPSNWRTIKKNGKNYRLVVLPGGYKALRQLQGKKTNVVNLNYSSKLQSELNLVAVNNKAEIGFISSYGGTISEAMEDKYGKKIWGVSKEDKKDIQNIVTEIIVREINE